MKAARMLTGLILAGIYGASVSLWAADPLQVAPNMYKLVFENPQVRVMEVSFKPGDKIAEHSHPDHYVYVLEGGQLTINKANSAPTVANVQPGQVLWIPAESHWAQNTGTTPVRLLVNELKVKTAAPKAKP
jgi:beta-alanine degradation protein BauB